MPIENASWILQNNNMIRTNVATGTRREYIACWSHEQFVHVDLEINSVVHPHEHLRRRYPGTSNRGRASASLISLLFRYYHIQLMTIAWVLVSRVLNTVELERERTDSVIIYLNVLRRSGRNRVRNKNKSDRWTRSAGALCQEGRGKFTITCVYSTILVRMGMRCLVLVYRYALAKQTKQQATNEKKESKMKK